MPASATDNFSQFIRSNTDLCGNMDFKMDARSRCCSVSHGSTPQSPSSPMNLSPRSSPPMSTLRRSLSSTFSLIPEEELESIEREKSRSTLYKLFTWFPFLLLNAMRSTINAIFQPAWGQMLVVVPTLWIAAWLWIFWKFIQIPLNVLKWIIELITLPIGEKRKKQRTVLISGGSTIQALHLARNFYSSGARVVVVELQGCFNLSKFSSSVDKYYTIAKPNPDNPHKYVKSLCEIVKLEKVNYYIPVCATSSAYFDAIAKPHLEMMGCSCFVPNLKEVTLLDDIAEVMHRCQAMTKPTPLYTTVTSKEEIDAWYDVEMPKGKKHFMASAGLMGIKERIKFIMPSDKNKFHLTREISDTKPWVVVQDMRGDHFLTCTTVKESKVLANVTCKIDPKNRGLTHEHNKEIDIWLKQFFAELCVQTPVTGHVTFRFVRDEVTGLILPLGAKIGVSLPYICYTSAHSKLLWRPCPHYKKSENMWMKEAILQHPGIEVVSKIIGNVLDKREALFAYWDPLPYCVYYQMQLPFSSLLEYIQTRERRLSGSSGCSNTDYIQKCSPTAKMVTACS